MRRINSSAGFTMLEVLVAILILVVALTEMVGLTATVVRANTSSKASTTATTLAGEKLEELKNTDYASLTDGTNTDYATSSGTVQTSASGAYYTRTWTIATDNLGTSTDTTDDMKNISVSVTWSWMGNSRQVTLSSKVAQ
ncbi:MAG: hypothetical protein A4E72_01218 [Syntrophus sp. PtaU1.Bin208]|nr:MAG: hypothetical protein A4E72_01218 [Syntrophus sp. PtaU1.Bin208]